VSSTNIDQIMELAEQYKILRARDLYPYRIPRYYLQRLMQRGMLSRIGRGLYTLPDERASEYQSLMEANLTVPKGVICLLSALRFHHLTTQAPFEVWIAIDRKAWHPQGDGVPLHIVRFSGPALREGVETHQLDGQQVRVYNPAKTIADCFKYRNKIGIDIAVEALRECWRKRRANMDEFWRYATICRVSNVMRPYLESLE